MYAFSCAAVLHPPPLRSHRRRGRTTLLSVTVSLSTTSESPILCSSSSSHHHNPSLYPFAPEVAEAVDSLYSEFRKIDSLVAHNSSRVLRAYQNARVGSHHFGGCTGYGHDEGGGREALDNAFAEIVGAESAIVRSQFFSGTHAITCALFALLRPGDELLAIAGGPYDTLEEVIGIRDSGGLGSLKDFGISYRDIPLAEDGGLNWDALASALKPQTKCALIQRSCGYTWRQSLSILEIERAIQIIKMQNPDCLVMVDNCYGEFVEISEPAVVGADLIAGSFIKNPGGTIAPCGGYVAGKRKWVEAAAARLSAPGLGLDCGSTPGSVMRAFFQGLFLAPQMVGEAIKGSFLIAEIMASKGYKVQPLPGVPRYDTVQKVGMKWAKYIVALGALKGMTTVLLVSAVGQARYLTHIARTHMVPPWFATVNDRTGTPIFATVTMLVATAIVAFFTDLPILSNLLSISTLFIFMLVAVALIVRRYYVRQETPNSYRKKLVFFITLILASSVATAVYWATSETGWVGYVVTVPVWFLSTLGLAVLVPKAREPKLWGVPMVPWLPSASIAINIFLLGSIDSKSFVRFGVWTGLLLVYYLFFGLHASYDTAKVAVERPVPPPVHLKRMEEGAEA